MKILFRLQRKLINFVNENFNIMLPKITIQNIALSQYERIIARDSGLPRNFPDYSQLLSHALIITGIRRCGKSTLMQQILKSSDNKAVYLNFEDPRLAGFDLGDFNRVYEIAQEANIETYFFDEIQQIDQWENFVRFRLDEGNRVFITGSNATMLSKELGTKLTGRHISKELFPFSYNEYISFKGFEANTDSLANYLNSGGFPEYIKTDNPEILMQNFNDIVIRDISVRHGLKNVTLLKQLAVWLISNTGKRFTGNSLKKSSGVASSSSMMEYLGYFADAYLFFYIPKFSFSYKVQLINPKKVYCIDNGLIQANSTSFTDDHGRMLENLVYLQLRRQVDSIFYFAEKHECDFVTFNKNKPKGIFQVCWQLNQDNIDRELNGIIEALEFFKKEHGQIITYDQQDIFETNGKRIDAIPFHLWATEGET